MNGISFIVSGFLSVARIIQRPNIKPTLTMLEPNAFPTATPTASPPIAEKMATESSGKDVENATRRKPIVVFPNPVMSATLTELVIVKWLALSSTKSEPSRINALTSMPSNKASHPLPAHFL